MTNNIWQTKKDPAYIHLNVTSLSYGSYHAPNSITVQPVWHLGYSLGNRAFTVHFLAGAKKNFLLVFKQPDQIWLSTSLLVNARWEVSSDRETK
jgi:hypothetical protein